MLISEPGLFDDDITSPLNLFLGSGFSSLARASHSRPLITGDDLKSELLTKFRRPELAALDLQSAYTIIENEDKRELDAFLSDRFTVEDYSPKYNAIKLLNSKYVYTTNIDDLIYNIYRPVGGEVTPILHDIMMFGAPRDLGNILQYVPLHGSVMHDPKRFIFSAGANSSAFASDQETWFVFQRELQRRPTFFLGYGMKDAGVLQALHNSRLQNANRWVLLRDATDEGVALYKSLGFHIIQGDIDQFLDKISSLGGKLKTKDNAIKVGATGKVPERNEIAQRPVRDFFLGAEPTWSDAYSPQIQRRRVNDRVMDQILQGHNVAVVGLPLSGKSTILKQVATDLHDKRQTLFFEKVSVAVARELIAEYATQSTKPIIIIDQFIDSRDAFNLLAEAGGFKFIIAESSVFFDSINVRNLKASLHVVPCTEVDKADLQKIVASMPLDIRRHEISYGGAEEDTEYLGLFEGLMRQVFLRDLTSKYRARLAEFESADQSAYDVYLMSCYTHLCRTPVSYDMIYLFAGAKDYVDGYKIVDRIREFLKEVDYSDDDSQDHFGARSGALAHITLRECSKNSFRRIFDRFHVSVSTKVIPDYRTFRRYAYDNDYTTKAYPDFRDGKAFYERLFAREDNPYDYQHGAVYMSKLHQHALAFDWIDTARSKAGKRAFAIRNSHAVILFEANFDIYRLNTADQTALDGINQSMTVLENCIEQDNWRGYHLLRYGDQAIKMASTLYSADVERWLLTAKSKIEDALKVAVKTGSRESYNASKYRRLLRQLEIALYNK